MGLAYNPGTLSKSGRANNFQVEYMINTTGDRWFIPYNNNASMADQVTQCDKLVGDTTDGSAFGSGVVPS